MKKLRWHIYNPSKKPAHKKHVDILQIALQQSGQFITKFDDADIIYVQTTGPYTSMMMLKALLQGKNVVYYYHEPSTIKEKMEKHDPFLYSLAVRLAHFGDYILSHIIIVSNDNVRKKLESVHPFLTRILRKQVLIAPLMIPDEFRDIQPMPPSRPTVLFLGRALPDHRQFTLFAELSARMKDVDFVVLTRDVLPEVEGARLKILHEGSFFSDDQRRNALMQADVVWTPYSVPYNQSGVIPDALCAGCAVVISDFELHDELRAAPITHVLPTRGTVDIEKLHDFLKEMHERHDWRRKQARDFYHRMHGLEAQLQLISSILEQVRG